MCSTGHTGDISTRSALSAFSPLSRYLSTLQRPTSPSHARSGGAPNPPPQGRAEFQLRHVEPRRAVHTFSVGEALGLHSASQPPLGQLAALLNGPSQHVVARTMRTLHTVSWTWRRLAIDHITLLGNSQVHGVRSSVCGRGGYPAGQLGGGDVRRGVQVPGAPFTIYTVHRTN